MAKDPGFKFYPGDYLRDTQCLSEAVQVAYDRIMCEHMRNICISQERHNFFTKRLSASEKEELNNVLIKCEDGYYIDWVRESILKGRAYSTSRAINREGKNKDKHKKDILTYVAHMDNDNDNDKDNDNIVDNKKKEPKIEFDLGVKMTQQEWDTLVNDFGPDITKKSASFLSSYKIEKDYKTKSDYLTIRRWVIDAVKKHTNGSSQNTNQGGKRSRNQGTYDFVNETAAEYFAIHGRAPEGEVQRPEDKGVGK